MKKRRIIKTVATLILLFSMVCIPLLYLMFEKKQGNTKDEMIQKRVVETVNDNVDSKTYTTSTTEEKTTDKNAQMPETTRDFVNDNSTIIEDDDSVKIELSSGLSTPGKGKLDIQDIQGFVQNNEKEVKKGEQSVKLSDIRLKIEAYGSYTGTYLEDGSDEPISGVSSIVITNLSDEMLQVADISIPINKKEKAEYRVTNLLPKTSALVLEKNKRIFSEKDSYESGEVISSYIKGQSLMSDVFEIKEENEQLTLINKTEQKYKKVYVYYKYIQIGGAYLGGITYRVPFENIDSKGSVMSVANHFSKGTSQIIDVQIVER
jgi:hypothetical protein